MEIKEELLCGIAVGEGKWAENSRETWEIETTRLGDWFGFGSGGQVGEGAAKGDSGLEFSQLGRWMAQVIS